MPINKKDNKKNMPEANRKSAIVPTKDEVGKKALQGSQKKVAEKRVTALSTVGKKKKPKH